MDKNQEQPLLYFKCKCAFENGIEILNQQLETTQKLLDAGQYRSDGEFSRLIKNMQKTVMELKKQQAQHLKFRVDYAREMVELVKTQAINVGPHQQKLQTVPFSKKEEKPKKKPRL